jgi:signal transduction histidine kinase
MQQGEQAAEFKETGIAATGLTETALAGVGLAEAGRDGMERGRVEAVVETLSSLHGHGESLEEVAHDARNMVTALGLYCDLLEEPGVLNPSFHHYGNELRLVATASRRLVEKLVTLDAHAGPVNDFSRTTSAAWTRTEPRGADRLERTRHLDLMPAKPIDNLAGELLANRNLLAALAGTSIALTVEAEGGAQPVVLTGEELTRILVNLVKNAAEAMPGGGRIHLGKTTDRVSLKRRWTRSSSRVTPPVPAARSDTEAGQPPIAGWACPSPVPSSRPRAATFMPPTAQRPEPASRSSCPSDHAEARPTQRCTGRETSSGSGNRQPS